MFQQTISQIYYELEVKMLVLDGNQKNCYHNDQIFFQSWLLFLVIRPKLAFSSKTPERTKNVGRTQEFIRISGNQFVRAIKTMSFTQKNTDVSLTLA